MLSAGFLENVKCWQWWTELSHWHRHFNSPDASYLPPECKSVQLINISLLPPLFCFYYSNIEEWLAIYDSFYFEEHNYQTKRSVLLHSDDLQRLCSEFVYSYYRYHFRLDLTCTRSKLHNNPALKISLSLDYRTWAFFCRRMIQYWLTVELSYFQGQIWPINSSHWCSIYLFSFVLALQTSLLCADHEGPFLQC